MIFTVSNKRHWGNRLEALKQYGLLNIGNKKVRVVLLHGTENIPNLTEGWPCDVIARSHDMDAPPTRFCGFFGRIGNEYWERARWFLKTDDDTITDVSNLVDKLDYEYDFERDYYVCCDYHGDLWHPYYEIVMDMGFASWFPENPIHPKWCFLHEWATGVISQTTMRRILHSNVAREFLRRCSKIDGGYGDHPLAVAARMCKVHALDCPFMTKDDCFEDLALFGGRMCHIHYLSPEKKKRWKAFIDKLKEYEIYGVKPELVVPEEPKPEKPEKPKRMPGKILRDKFFVRRKKFYGKQRI